MQARRQGRLDGSGLLHDLLEHEVLIAAFLRRLDAPGHAVDGLLDGLSGAVEHLDGFWREHGDLAVFQIDDVFRVRHQCGHIGGKVVLPHADAEDQWACLTHGIERIRRVGAEDPQGIRALQPCRRLHDGGFDISVIILQCIRIYCGDLLCTISCTFTIDRIAGRFRNGLPTDISALHTVVKTGNGYK